MAIALFTGPLDPSNLEDTLNQLINKLNAIPAINSGVRQQTVIAATLAPTAANNGQTFLLNRAAGVAVTLPAATGSGNIFTFVTATTFSGGSGVISTTPTTDIFQGFLLGCSEAETPDLGQPWVAASNSNTITLNGTTMGGIKGDIFTIRDVGPGVWNISGQIIQTGSEVTPFSHV